MKLALSLLVWLLLVAGCSSVKHVPQYEPSFKNINTLEKLKPHARPIALGRFSDPNDTRSVHCNSGLTIPSPNPWSYVDYIKQALENELKFVDLYDRDSPIVLEATLDTINATAFKKQQWLIEMTFMDHHQKPYTVHNLYSFQSSSVNSPFAGKTDPLGCLELSERFVQAVQQFFVTLYQDPNFINTLQQQE